METTLVHRIECRTEYVAVTGSRQQIGILARRYGWVVVVVAHYGIDLRRVVVLGQIWYYIVDAETGHRPETVPRYITENDGI